MKEGSVLYKKIIYIYLFINNRIVVLLLHNTCMHADCRCRRRLTWVLGQNGSGQNGTDKMVWTKWYTDKMLLDKMVRTKWYGQSGIAKKLPIKSSINLAPIDNLIFSSIQLPL